LELKSSFGSRLKEIRTRKNLTLEEFSKLVRIPAQTLNRYELGQRIPKFDLAVELAEKLQVNPYWLAGYDFVKDDELILLSKYLLSIGYGFEYVHAQLENGALKEVQYSNYDADGKIQLPKIERRVPCIRKGETSIILTQEQFLELNKNIKHAIDYELSKYI
jgi:transcriptional regulator with XRE-family HTH domain